jgi:hypothetical protein
MKPLSQDIGSSALEMNPEPPACKATGLLQIIQTRCSVIFIEIQSQSDQKQSLLRSGCSLYMWA